jgi:hypothetical protein
MSTEQWVDIVLKHLHDALDKRVDETMCLYFHKAFDVLVTLDQGLEDWACSQQRPLEVLQQLFELHMRMARDISRFVFAIECGTDMFLRGWWAHPKRVRHHHMPQMRAWFGAMTRRFREDGVYCASFKEHMIPLSVIVSSCSSAMSADGEGSWDEEDEEVVHMALRAGIALMDPKRYSVDVYSIMQWMEKRTFTPQQLTWCMRLVLGIMTEKPVDSAHKCGVLCRRVAEWLRFVLTKAHLFLGSTEVAVQWMRESVPDVCWDVVGTHESMRECRDVPWFTLPEPVRMIWVHRTRFVRAFQRYHDITRSKRDGSSVVALVTIPMPDTPEAWAAYAQWLHTVLGDVIHWHPRMDRQAWAVQIMVWFGKHHKAKGKLKASQQWRALRMACPDVPVDTLEQWWIDCEAWTADVKNTNKKQQSFHVPLSEDVYALEEYMSAREPPSYCDVAQALCDEFRWIIPDAQKLDAEEEEHIEGRAADRRDEVYEDGALRQRSTYPMH